MFQGSSVSLSGLRSVTTDQDVPGGAVYLCQVLDLLRGIKMFQGEQCVSVRS